MKDAAQSMTQREAAQAFYGQDESSFYDMVAKLAANDPRLSDVFKSTRRRFLEAKKS
ncbi:hypothetical protein MWU60_14360 [Yoonia sp. F2084L]|uniref:hypothetical protein n=1 Tax=Yoonia sp. F2084L TaxID=2926419 RepID=UPI001FF2724C|nr:hypothetical protein [Yoonia sp. F2084L]MCK0096760.1 hypothetical protein [Yoonia sp. F2084L]